MGTFYAVGVGPGDPRLMTLRAVEVIRAADVVAAPRSGAERNLALQIADAYLAGKEILELDMPMTRDEDVLARSHAAAAEALAVPLRAGRTVAFLTLGDPGIYSTVMYVYARVAAMGFAAEVIPGVPSFCAAAAALGRPLCERAEPLHILPASYPGTAEALALDGCRVLMKSGRSFGALRESLRGRHAQVVECASLPSQRVWPCDEQPDETPGYFSIVIVPPAEK